MYFSFQGTDVATMKVDPLEFAGMSQTQIAGELHGMAKAVKNLDYNSEDFFFAADEVLREIAGR